MCIGGGSLWTLNTDWSTWGLVPPGFVCQYMVSYFVLVRFSHRTHTFIHHSWYCQIIHRATQDTKFLGIFTKWAFMSFDIYTNAVDDVFCMSFMYRCSWLITILCFSLCNLFRLFFSETSYSILCVQLTCFFFLCNMILFN